MEYEDFCEWDFADMVASGVPEAYPTHAIEVARMAISLVNKCKSFVIPHFPDQKLKIRVGIHSGIYSFSCT